MEYHVQGEFFQVKGLFIIMKFEEILTITDWMLPKYITVGGHDGILQL